MALVGLRFGAGSIPISLHHPHVESLTICDLDEPLLHKFADRYAVKNRTPDFDEVIASKDIDAVHLITPLDCHAKQSVAVLESGKHCACTVPMGMTLEELRAVISAQRSSGKNYMMMETAVYTREYLYAKDLMAAGEFGPITFVSGAHYQDLEGWPSYWKGLPPLLYITHAISPGLSLLGTRATRVHCFGSGQLRDDLREMYDNPFPFETAIFKLENTPIAAQVSRFMFQTARSYTESFAIYGEAKSFEWQQLEDEDPIVFTMGEPTEKRGRPISAERISVPDRPDLLPNQIARFTKRGVYDESRPHLSFLQGGGHGGSHPHMVHEFVSSIVEGRRAWVDEIAAANWTAAGICAHESAMRDAAGVDIPNFREWAESLSGCSRIT